MGFFDNAPRLQRFLYITNGILLVLGCLCIGIGAWMAVEKVFISDIVGNDLFSTATYIVIFCGCVLFITTFVGLLGVHMKNRPILIIFIICLVLIFVLFLVSGIVAAIFQGQLESTAKSNMRNAILYNYGYNEENDANNKRITESWDFFQHRLQCCAVEDDGYTLYLSSKWYQEENNAIQVYGVNSVYNRNPSYNVNPGGNYGTGYHNPDQETKYIPESCCKDQGTFKTPDWTRFCQSNQWGPPAIPGDRHNNYAMNFKGCYTAAEEFVKDSGAIIIALGFVFALLLVVAIIFAIAFCKIAGKRSHFAVPANDYPVSKEMEAM